ncbi:MAG: DUF4167 domain-containing protein [Paracoccus sp. (in: a-proteobacteria)]
MRSSKSRSRSKSNRQRSLGNIVNRVFDSSGPEGKVRGTPQQIIDKYLTLARDAQLSNDRVAEQAFLQHAEHYTRLLGEAQREMAERQQQQQQNQNQNRAHGGGERDQSSAGRDDDASQQPRGEGGRSQDGNRGGSDVSESAATQPDTGKPSESRHTTDERQQADRSSEGEGNGLPDALNVDGSPAEGRVETPEESPQPRRRAPRSATASRSRRKPAAVDSAATDNAAPTANGDTDQG